MGNNNPNEPIIPGHEYDGIKELDNPLPGWWLVTFYGTIIFSFIYYIHYTFTSAPNLRQEFNLAMEEINKAKATAPATAGSASEAELAGKMGPDQVASGKAPYVAKCAACHMENGAGMVGPNLTDSHWIHGTGARTDIMSVVANGVPEKGMPAWKDMLSADEMNNVVAYVYSLKNTNVAGGKAPEGNQVK